MFHLMCLQLMLATSTAATGSPEPWQHIIGSEVQEDTQWLQKMEESTWLLHDLKMGE